jgi:hypothetical protein
VDNASVIDDEAARSWQAAINAAIKERGINRSILASECKCELSSLESWLKPSAKRLCSIDSARRIHSALADNGVMTYAYYTATGQNVTPTSLSSASWILGQWEQRIAGAPVVWEGRRWHHKAGDTCDLVSVDHVSNDGSTVIGSIVRMSPEADPPDRWTFTGALKVHDAVALYLDFEESQMNRFSRGILALTLASESKDLLTGVYVLPRSSSRALDSELTVQNASVADQCERVEWHQMMVPRPVVWYRRAPRHS